MLAPLAAGRVAGAGPAVFLQVRAARPTRTAAAAPSAGDRACARRSSAAPTGRAASRRTTAAAWRTIAVDPSGPRSRRATPPALPSAGRALITTLAPWACSARAASAAARERAAALAVAAVREAAAARAVLRAPPRAPRPTSAASPRRTAAAPTSVERPRASPRPLPAPATRAFTMTTATPGTPAPMGAAGRICSSASCPARAAARRMTAAAAIRAPARASGALAAGAAPTAASCVRVRSEAGVAQA